jgi:hypothetical protein
MDLQPDQVYATLTSSRGTIAFGAVDEFGVDWGLESLDGWAGGTSSTADVVQKPRQSGGWRGDGFAVARSVAMSGGVYAPSADALSASFDRLNAACPVGSDAILTVVEAGRSRWAKVRRSDDVITSWLMPTIGRWSVQMDSTDWRKFGADVSGSTALPSTTGGLTVPFTVPFTINAVTVTGQVSLTNPGNEPGPVVLRIDGPCQGPVITHVSSGAQLVFSSSLVLGAGEFLLIDMERRSVLANGQASRSGYITSRGWSQFDPGVNTYSFTAAVYDAASKLTVTGTPAWS